MKKIFWKNKLVYLVSLMWLTVCLSGESLAQKAKPKPKPKTQSVSKTSPADKILKEGLELFDQGTATSYQAALLKFTEAQGLYQQNNNPLMRGECYLQIGRTYKRLNNFQQAFQSYHNALDLFYEVKDNEGRSSALNNLGVITRDNGLFKESLSYYEQALDLMRLTKDKKGEAQVLNGMGESLWGAGNFNEARSNFQKAELIWQSIGASEDKVRTTFNLGRSSLASNEVEQGLNYLNRALAESRQYDNPLLEGDILESLAAYHLATGDLTKAIDYRLRVFDAFTKPKAFSVVSISRVLQSVNSLVVSYYRAGDFPNALKYLEQGISIGNQRNEKVLTSYLIGNKGVLLGDQGKYQEAVTYLNQGITAARSLGNKHSEAYFLASLGQVYSQLGDYPQAVNFSNQALQVVPAGEPESEGRVLSALINAYVLSNNQNKARETIQLAETRNITFGLNAGAIQVLYAQGFANLYFGNTQEGMRLLNQAFVVADKLNHEVEKAKILYTAAFGYERTGDLQNAFQAALKSHDFWKKVGNEVMDMNTHFQMGVLSFKLNQFQTAIENFNSVLNFAQNFNLTEKQASTHYNLGLAYLNLKDTTQSINHFNQALSFYESLGDGKNQIQTMNDLAVAYEMSGDKNRAKDLRNKAKKIKN